MNLDNYHLFYISDKFTARIDPAAHSMEVYNTVRGRSPYADALIEAFRPMTGDFLILAQEHEADHDNHFFVPEESLLGARNSDHDPMALSDIAAPEPILYTDRSMELFIPKSARHVVNAIHTRSSLVLALED